MTRCLCFVAHRYALLLLLLASCCACVSVHAGAKSADVKSPEGGIALFVNNKTKVALQPNGNGRGQEVTVSFFGAPILLAAKNAVIALAEATYTTRGTLGDNKRADPVATYIEANTIDWSKQTLKESDGKLKAQFVRQNTSGDIFFLRTSVGVAKDNKVYLLSVNRCTNTSGRTTPTADHRWYFRLSVGTVTNDANKRMTWKTSKSSSVSLENLFKKQSLTVDARARTGDYAFLTGDRKVLFVVRARKENQDGYAIIRMSDIKKKVKSWEISYVATAENTVSYFFLFGKRLMMLTKYKNGSNKLTESTDMGKNWIESAGPIAHLWDNLWDKDDFITATLENKKTVVLFTELGNVPGATDTYASHTKKLHLWVTDGNRLYDAGPIPHGNKWIFYSGLLYTEGKLFFIYQQLRGKSEYVVFLAQLKEQMDRVKKEVATWTAQDNLLSTTCPFAGVDGRLQRNKDCVASTPTTGLVGFLSNNTTKNGTESDKNNIWKDDYLFADATVTNGEKVENGFKFSKHNAGAVWTVGTRGERRWYNFEADGLTLMAMVTIDGASKNDYTSLMGVVLVDGNGKERHIELLCGRDQRWKLATDSVVATLGVTMCEPQKQYHVTLVYTKGGCSLYINFQLLGAIDRFIAGTFVPANVSYLYFGVDTTNTHNVAAVDTNVTVRNVFLYNWAFNQSSIAGLIRTNRVAAQTLIGKQNGVSRQARHCSHAARD